MFKPLPGFYRVGADATKATLWLHFHFPDMAKQRYTDQIATLADQTGWKVYLYPHVSEKALIDAVKRLLPEALSITGNASVYQHMKTVSVNCTGEMSAETKEEVERRWRSIR